MSYQPAETLTNRTFVGLIVAQFLAGFNDQAIHASAMFYAIHTKILSESNAITLMPILFYAPWALFCTLAGYYADRYSKTTTLRIWKIAEIVISLIMIAGFVIGGNVATVKVGGWMVMACVFLMGTHAAFFAPAKYGAMPEILRPHILSRGNGILEMTTFLASIFGTVAGGLLFTHLRGHEVWIGIILLVLSVLGAAASFLIARLPASSPERRFPPYLFKPLLDNLKVMARSRSLALAVLGIAFFIFMVSYMRAAMYMHGETRNPRWDEQQTSLIVATVALGVGLGSPFAGYLSGGKVELGLVPLGCLGMIFALVASAITIEWTQALVVALIVIGFFSGFYMVPLYTLLQQRAPKQSKGDFIATSNFVNVTGAIAASILFKVLVLLSIFTGVTPEVQLNAKIDAGILQGFKLDDHGKLRGCNLQMNDGAILKFRARKAEPREGDAFEEFIRGLGLALDLEPREKVIDFDDNFFDVLSGMPKEGDEVAISSYELRGRTHFLIRRADQTPSKVYDNEILPRYLFLGAALMTMAILFLLCRKLPDFFVRTLFWYQALGKFRLKAVGVQHLPTEGPVILATNSADLQRCLQLVSATDRTTKVVLVEDGTALAGGVLLRRMAERTNIIAIHPRDVASWTAAREEALRTLRGGHLLAVSVANEAQATGIDEFLRELQRQTNAPLLPVYCGALEVGRVRVVFGERSAPGTADAVITINDCKKAIGQLGEWIRANDSTAGMEH
jgi:MFS family permease